MRCIGLVALSLAAWVAVPTVTVAAETTWQPDHEKTWQGCDGQPRPGPKAVYDGLRLVFAPMLAIGSQLSSTLPPPVGLAEGRQGVEACRAAMADGRSREWPERRAMQHFAYAIHLLDAVLRGEGDAADLQAAKSAWLSDPNANASNPRVRWLVEPYFDLMLAVAAAQRGDSGTAGTLENVMRRRAGSHTLASLAAEAALSEGMPVDVRNRVWWSSAAYDPRRLMSAAGMTEARSTAYLPTRDMLRQSLLPALLYQLATPVYASGPLVYKPSADGDAEGYSAKTDARGQMVVSYRVKGAPAPLATEFATFRAAELAREAGKTHFLVQSVSALGKVMRQFESSGLSVDSQPLEVTIEMTVVFGNPGSETVSALPAVLRDPRLWLSVDAVLGSLDASPFKAAAKS
ncbi:hypothetical protein [Asticcacaulis sp.]|uniref:hypothetical protein n=1 Tax=Asticcacaulis sp. TaxID=1872648 RepID=UPI0026164BBB|nr:hypothetical protein [Asticcacaulis sp.]